ncbi:Uncharacterized protein DAT39_000347 [Clarias magur]|uniref:Uncharacterized protein n=1 Tax=Clarias magur TaxID=1594786 RepID=A0A8J4XHI1_CLAMG|nr:Uncharacterized protein DAT39_000347 [Clarias magur]
MAGLDPKVSEVIVVARNTSFKTQSSSIEELKYQLNEPHQMYWKQAVSVLALEDDQI